MRACAVDVCVGLWRFYMPVCVCVACLSVRACGTCDSICAWAVDAVGCVYRICVALCGRETDYSVRVWIRSVWMGAWCVGVSRVVRKTKARFPTLLPRKKPMLPGWSRIQWPACVIYNKEQINTAFIQDRPYGRRKRDILMAINTSHSCSDGDKFRRLDTEAYCPDPTVAHNR